MKDYRGSGNRNHIMISILGMYFVKDSIELWKFGEEEEMIPQPECL